jgi:hypothetical protein
MSLALALQEEIRAYLSGRVTLDGLREWLDERMQAIEDADDDALDGLADRAWTLFAELDYGHRDELEVRRELLASLSAREFPRRMRRAVSS